MALGDFLARLGGRGEEPRTPEPESQVERPPTAEALVSALEETERLVAGGAVPSPVTARVLRVTATVRDTIPRLGSLGAGSDRAYSVMATATDYLPEAVGGYLRLPRRFADTRPVDGPKTALMVLVDQLDLLGATMDGVFDAVCRDDANALVAHGRFLSEKFGSRSRGGDLEVSGLPTSSPEAMAVAAAMWDEAARSEAGASAPGGDVGPAPLRPPSGATPDAPPPAHSGIATPEPLLREGRQAAPDAEPARGDAAGGDKGAENKGAENEGPQNDGSQNDGSQNDRPQNEGLENDRPEDDGDRPRVERLRPPSSLDL